MMKSGDLFDEINNAVLDLQASDAQSFSRPLKKLGRLLRHPDLEAVNRELSGLVDVEAFVRAGEETQGGMVGSAELPWPDDDRQTLALQLLLTLKLSDEPGYMEEFSYRFYYSGNRVMSGVSAVIGQLIIPFARDYKAYVLRKGDMATKLVRPLSKRIFIVHGHDGEARETVARFLGNIGFTPIILHEQANRGRTVIEKVEANADVGFAVVLLTPDDLGKAKTEADLEPRARQNVLLELGYFLAHLGRDKVCALKKGTVQIPSDFAGVLWEAMDDAGGWKQKLARELQAAGHDIDWNAVMR